MPGPLTIILEANDKVPYWVNSDLTTVGFRMPSHPVTLELIREFGPLIGPSANISGQSSGVSFKEILKDFDQEVLGLEDDAFLTGQDSTIIDLSEFGKGIAYINGHHLGRFWNVGPTLSLYIPHSYLEGGANRIIIFTVFWSIIFFI